MAQGPLDGVKVLEIGGLGPISFSGMMLSDFGADVVRIERADVASMEGFTDTPFQFDARGRRSVALNLKDANDAARCLALLDKADIALEAYRPGVAERLGVGPDVALARNPRLVYGRLTGYGQTGPYAQVVGHDPNFLSMSGMMHLIGTPEKPVSPLTLVCNYGGAIAHVAGILAALHHARMTGEGQVIDTASWEVASYMGTMIHAMIAAGIWNDGRESNLLDGGAPCTGNFRCSDGRWVSLGAAEPKHWAKLLEKLGLADEVTQNYLDSAHWPAIRAALDRVFATRTQQEWRDIMDGAEVCFAPVLTPQEAIEDAHSQARKSFVTVAGAVQPAPVPRFSVTPAAIQGPPPVRGAHTDSVFVDWGADQS